MTEQETVADAVDELLSLLDADDEVAFAEVGGVYREACEIVVTERGVRSSNDHTTTGVWCRVFANGAAGYRYTDDLSADSLADTAERATIGAAQLAQSTPARVDAESLHRGAHDGWAHQSVTARDLPTTREAVREAAGVLDTTPDRLRLTYADERADVSLATTAGSTVHTVLDRASADVTLVPENGPKLQRHVGTTRGADLLDRLPEVLADLDRDARELVDTPAAEHPEGPATVVLGPAAAAQLAHVLAGYLHADIAAFGFSPFGVGDRLTDAPLTIDDTVSPGAWSALAYDAEARPTTPVRLVDRGRVESFLHDTATAAHQGQAPAGNAVPALGFEQPPRIHHRHLQVHAGDTDREALLADADLYVRRFGPAYYRDEFERTQRDGTMPASSLYAHDVAEKLGEKADPGTFELPVMEGFRVDDGELGGRVDPTLLWTPETVETVDGIGRTRRRISGVASKHKSRIPYDVTAPALRVRAAFAEK